MSIFSSARCAPLRRLAGVVPLLVVWSAEARASEVFPDTIRDRLALTAAPPCTICHASDEGEKGTVVKPFGVSMQRLGVAGQSDTRKLIAALASAERQRLDSDFDGVPDISELRDGTDPNDGIDLPIPETGCSLAPARSLALRAPLVALALGIVAFWSRSRRRASTRVAQHANRR